MSAVRRTQRTFWCGWRKLGALLMEDMLGQEIHEGDYVAGNYSTNTTPHIFQVCGYTPKKVRLLSLEDDTRTSLKYPHDLIKVDPVAVQQTNALPPTDSIGQLLEIGNTVYTSNGEYIDPVICVITGFAPRMVKLKKVFGQFDLWNSSHRLLSDVIKVESTPEITMHCLTKEK